MTAAPSLAVQVDPDSDRPVLLLIHGMLSSALHWQPNATLAQQFRRVMVELPGHGASAAPATPEEVRPGAIAAAIERVRQTLGFASWHVCGASFGAGIALRYALDHPGVCQSVSFTNGNSALRAAWSMEELQAQSGLAARIRARGRDAVRAMPYHPGHARRFPPTFREALVAEADLVTPETVALLQQEAMPRMSVRDRLGQMQPPCLLINGTFERRFQPLRDWLAQAHPQIGIVDLPGGHSVNIECPEDFNAALTAFIRNSGT